MIDTPHPCSCPMCGNQRAHAGPTRQERRVETGNIGVKNMTVAELKDLLDEYPDHWPVEVEWSDGTLVEIDELEQAKTGGVNLVRVVCEQD